MTTAKTFLLEQTQTAIKDLATNFSKNDKYTKELVQADLAVHIAKSNLLALKEENKSLLKHSETLIIALKEIGFTKKEAENLTGYSNIPIINLFDTVIKKVYGE